VAIYAGGGTPTTLSAPQLDSLCTCVEEEFDLSGMREYSVEAGRPDTITEEKLLVLRRHGVDRVSVNPQTMRDEVLEAIGRKHTAGDILEALEKVRKVGGFAVNMDLIAGLPKDDPEGFAKSLEQVLALKPENITIHTLSLKRGSTLMAQPGIIPTAAEVGRMLDNAYRRLSGEDYAPYYLYRQKNMSGGFENTGWTKQGYENLYNICMMEELCSILASGGGGSTKLIHPEGGKNIRITAPKYPLEYIQQIEKTCEEKRRIGEFYEYDVRSR
jgi:oxygen-independent coproporphyrinogen-3 oxidase